jgi:hypothetical protein
MEIFHNREITFLIVKVGGGAEDIVGRQGLGKSQLRTEDAPGNVVVVGSVPCRVRSSRRWEPGGSGSKRAPRPDPRSTRVGRGAWC